MIKFRIELIIYITLLTNSQSFVLFDHGNHFFDFLNLSIELSDSFVMVIFVIKNKKRFEDSIQNYWLFK